MDVNFSISDSPYRSHIDETVLKLKEDETIRRLKLRWWQERNIGEEDCSIEDDGKDSELTMQNVGGIFLVLFAGCGIAIIIGLMEFLWNVKRVSINEKVYLLYHVFAESALNSACSKNTYLHYYS